MNSDGVTKYITGAYASNEVTSAEVAIDWLRTMRVSPTEYNMNEGADVTIFTSCFALFILDLLHEIDRFSNEEKAQVMVMRTAD
jgi:hypothetical protein